MLVEDEDLVCELMAEMLRDDGYEVVEAADGRQAFASLSVSPERYAILVTDFHMPGGLDGARVAERFREAVPQGAVVIATGRPDVMRSSWRDKLGYVLLSKPFGPGELIGTVRQLVGPPRASGS